MTKQKDGIIGSPAWERGKTWLYLSGENTRDALANFSEGPLETTVVGDEIGKASALKMCYAAYTKGTTALLGGILATANVMGVRSESIARAAIDAGARVASSYPGGRSLRLSMN